MLLPIPYNGNSIYIISVWLPTLKEFFKVIALYSCVAHVYVFMITVVEMC